MIVLIIYQWPEFWAMGEGAGASSFFETAHAYVRHGHDVRVVLPTLAGETDGEYHGMRLARVPFTEDPMSVESGLAGLLSRIRRYVSFRRRMKAAALVVARAEPPDVIVALGAHSAAVAHGVGRKLGIPNVTRLFGQSLSLHLDANGRIRSLRFLVNFPELIAFRTPCAGLIVHDDGSRGDRVAGILGASDRLHFWRDGRDPLMAESGAKRVEVRRALGFEEDDIVVASVGRISPEKDLDDTVTAFAHAARRVPALRLLFVGDGPLLSHYESMCDRMGLAQRVRFAGAVQRDRLPDLFAAMDVVISTSARTNMTNSTIEAMGLGIPVLALDTGDTGRVILDGENGVLVAPTEKEHLGEALASLAADPERRERLGNNARAFILEHFETVEERTGREVRLVERLAKERARRS